jgi:hypothetical protein
MNIFSIQFSPPSSNSSLTGPNIPLSTLFANTLSLCSFLSVRDEVSHPYETTGKFSFLVFTFLDGQEDKDSEWNGSKHSLTLTCY